MKSKQLEKGIQQLTDEGVAQLFTLELNGRKVIGTVGALQYEVIQYRLKNEYGATCDFKSLNYHLACWITTKNEEQLNQFVKVKGSDVGYDKDGNPVFLAPSAWMLEKARENYADLEFHTTSEFKVQL